MEEKLNKEYNLWRRNFQQELVSDRGIGSGAELITAINQDELEAQLANLGRNNEKGRPDNGGLISAACFINAMDTINSINDWVMKDIAYPYEIKSIVNEINWSRRR